ncbi:hypothetical protein [Paraburkholderia sp. HP33-1]|uniref:hypothetical protein n=1 Tax=Paraburkholderia sp. HP33-1 TaxID=2883243 RepID=UPI001F472B32|nr:hypothetical protein [Paraburkholderia sp. HP33-1]
MNHWLDHGHAVCGRALVTLDFNLDVVQNAIERKAVRRCRKQAANRYHSVPLPFVSG